jgi:hypothetical protein
MNGEQAAALTNPAQSGLLTALSAPLFSDEQRVEALFLAALARLPDAVEAAKFHQHLQQSTSKPTALGDLLWALVNSAEFGFNH